MQKIIKFLRDVLQFDLNIIKIVFTYLIVKEQRNKGSKALALRLPEKQPPREPGGAEQARTADLRLARAALSQLSYSPRELPPKGGPS
jgi:hypothetical protein